MEHTTHPKNQGTTVKGGKNNHKTRTVVAGRVSACLRGFLYLGAAYLLGTFALPFGAMPLGFALLGAASTSTVYIWLGLCLSALHSAFPFPFWVGWILYTATLLLRLLLGWLSRRQLSPQEKKKVPSALDRLTAFAEQLWGTEQEVDTATDYYCGRRQTPMKYPEAEDEKPAPEAPLSLALFGESRKLRVLCATLGSFSMGLGLMISGGFAVYDLLGFLLALTVTPPTTFLLCPCFSEEGQQLWGNGRMPDALPRRGHDPMLERFSALTLISALLLLFLVTLSAKIHVLTLYSPYITLHLAPILAIILSLRITAVKGIIPGMVTAIICGLAADPLFSPALILAVLAFGLLRLLSVKVAIAGGCMATILWTLFGMGVDGLVAYLPSVLLAVPLCLLTQKLDALFPSGSTVGTQEERMQDFSAAMAQKTRAESHRARLEAISEAFTSLSRMFYDLSGQLRKPKQSELRRMCDEVMDRHCARCRYREKCDRAVCHPADLMAARLSNQLYRKGKADTTCLPPETAQDCLHLPGILEDVNNRYAKMVERLIKHEHTEDCAADYESMADVLRDTLDEDEEEFRCNSQAADAIFDLLSCRGVTVLGVVVCGKRNCRIIVRGSHFDRSEQGLSALRADMEKICDVKLSLPSFESDGSSSAVSVMRLSSVAVYDTVYSGSTVPAGHGKGDILPLPLTNERDVGTYLPPAACGDHIALFKSDRACFYALISDGMGSGEDAALTSDICALFLEKMLSAGNRVELSVRMLNSFIRQKNQGTGDECSATVDLMELDLMSGQAVFAKNGAAPTYVVRGGRVFKLRSRTLPIGILKDSDPQLLRFRMNPGDVVVMVSDGVTNGNDECPWLIELLSSPLPESMDSLRLRILRQAIASGSPDDLSAIAVRVEGDTVQNG